MKTQALILALFLGAQSEAADLSKLHHHTHKHHKPHQKHHIHHNFSQKNLKEVEDQEIQKAKSFDSSIENSKVDFESQLEKSMSDEQTKENESEKIFN